LSVSPSHPAMPLREAPGTTLIASLTAVIAAPPAAGIPGARASAGSRVRTGPCSTNAARPPRSR
jgi:hypothetical protein